MDATAFNNFTVPGWMLAVGGIALGMFLCLGAWKAVELVCYAWRHFHFSFS
jgi:hypothetical protein